MRTLIFATAALLSVGAGSAFASGEGWDMSCITTVTPTEAPATARVAKSLDGAIPAYGYQGNRTATSDFTARSDAAARTCERG